MKIKNKDIARAAGVSVATVDRVLNERPGVHERTAALVRAVMEQMVADQIASPRQVARRSTEEALSPLPVLTVDVVLPEGTNLFIELLAEAFAREGHLRKSESVHLRVHRLDVFEPAAFASALNRIGEHSSGVIVIALDHPLTREAIRRLDCHHVPTITLATDIASCPRFAYVGVDNRAAGRTAGLLMGRLLKARSGKIALIAGSRSFRGHEERGMGFRALIEEEFPSLDIVGVREGHDEDVENIELMQDLVASVPDLIGVYSIGAGNRGIGQVLVDSGAAGNVIFIGHELTTETRHLLLHNVMDAAIVQDPDQEVIAALDLMIGRLREDHDRAPQPIKIEVVLRENLP